MARPLRIEFAGAIYHLMSRGNAGQVIFSDDADRQRLVDGLKQAVVRCGWELFGVVWMPNHIHLFLRTPRPNLSRGMQRFLSGYANWYAKRHRRPGHLCLPGKRSHCPGVGRLARAPIDASNAARAGHFAGSGPPRERQQPDPPH